MRFTRCCLATLVVLVLGTAVAAPPEKELMGKWSTVDPDSQSTITLDFAANNALKISVGGVTLDAKYKFIDDDNLELSMTFGDNISDGEGQVQAGEQRTGDHRQGQQADEVYAHGEVTR